MEASPIQSPTFIPKAARTAGFRLIIERGVSQFPMRPIIGERFLIGAGSNCQLQLGGEIPLLHSIIIPEGDHLWIDAVSPSPALFVNGQPVRDGELDRGDVIAIGDFVFCVDYRRPHAAVEVPEPAADRIHQEIGEYSAAELLQLLEKDLADLNQFESVRQQGATAMLQASRQHLDLSAINWQVDSRASLLQILSQLNDRSRALDLREAALAEYAQRLAHSQEELRRQLEALCARTLPAETIIQDEEELRRSA